MQDPDLIPMELKNLAGKTYLFKVAIERDNFLYKNGTYRVLKIVTNIEMITEFENLRQPQVPISKVFFSVSMFRYHYMA